MYQGIKQTVGSHRRLWSEVKAQTISLQEGECGSSEQYRLVKGIGRQETWRPEMVNKAEHVSE